MSSGLRLSRIGKEAQCFAISSSLSARRRLLRRLFICSRRSFNAFVTASVFVSPVRAARSEANFSVSGFRMFNAMFHYRLKIFYIVTFYPKSNFLQALSFVDLGDSSGSSRTTIQKEKKRL